MKRGRENGRERESEINLTATIPVNLRHEDQWILQEEVPGVPGLRLAL